MHKKNLIVGSVVLAVLVLGVLFYGHKRSENLSSEEKVFKSIADSHVQGNVPDQDNFDIFIKRDLQTYFDSYYKTSSSTIEYELLRQGPTQTGMAFPKYYLWVKVLKNDKDFGQGAVRVAAVDKSEFRVTDYLTKENIDSNIEQIYQVFPSDVCEKIKTKL
jgi:hypothetical protein